MMGWDLPKRQQNQRKLVSQFLGDAPKRLQNAFMWACVDRVLRGYVPVLILSERPRQGALEATALQRLPEFTSKYDAVSRSTAAEALRTISSEKPSDMLKYAELGKPADVVHQVWLFLMDEREGMEAFLPEELDAEEAWILKHWKGAPKPLTKKTLADLDAYIANGLLLGDDE